MAMLHDDRVTGMRNNQRVFGNQIEIRCWNSLDARTDKPTRLSFDLPEKIAVKITKVIPEVVSVTYNIATKPPSTIEAV
jgi:GMP synthase (glutamine-hydrolysing)